MQEVTHIRIGRWSIEAGHGVGLLLGPPVSARPRYADAGRRSNERPGLWSPNVVWPRAAGSRVRDRSLGRPRIHPVSDDVSGSVDAFDRPSSSTTDSMSSERSKNRARSISSAVRFASSVFHPATDPGRVRRATCPGRSRATDAMAGLQPWSDHDIARMLAPRVTRIAPGRDRRNDRRDGPDLTDQRRTPRRAARRRLCSGQSNGRQNLARRVNPNRHLRATGRVPRRTGR